MPADAKCSERFKVFAEYSKRITFCQIRKKGNNLCNGNNTGEDGG